MELISALFCCSSSAQLSAIDTHFEITHTPSHKSPRSPRYRKPVSTLIQLERIQPPAKSTKICETRGDLSDSSPKCADLPPEETVENDVTVPVTQVYIDTFQEPILESKAPPETEKKQLKKTHAARHSLFGSGSVAPPKARPKIAGASQSPAAKLSRNADKDRYRSKESLFVPSNNSSFSFCPSVVDLGLNEKYKLDACLITAVAKANQELKKQGGSSKKSRKSPPVYTVSDSPANSVQETNLHTQQSEVFGSVSGGGLGNSASNTVI